MKLNFRALTDKSVRRISLLSLILAAPFVSGCLAEGHPETVYPVTAIRVLPLQGTVRIGQTVSFTASALDEFSNPIQGKTYVWASSDSSIALTLPGGIVRGVKAGNATISSTADGKTGQAGITVTP